jgi:hypothetical protein
MKAEQNGISRRSFLTTASGLALGVGVAHLPGTARAADPLPALPWGPTYYPKAGLDPDAVAEAAYGLYYKEGGCGHGSAQALIDALAAALDDEGASENPWKLLPRGLYSYGAGGVVGWGTICGALNGAIAVMDIVGVHNALGNALVDYFCNAELPTTALVGYVPPTGIPAPLASIATSVSHSPLCHNSVSNWAATAGVPVADASKKDRCAKLVGDIVAKAVVLMNDRFLSSVTPAAWSPPASYATCYTCHTKPDMEPSQQGKMECQACHTVARGHGSWKRNRNGRR